MLAIDNTSASLIDNLICQPADPADFLAQRLDDQDESQIFSTRTCRGVDREPRIAQHFLSDGQQLAVSGDLLSFSLGRSHALELLHSAAGAAFPVGESRHALAGDLTQACDQTCQNADGIPKQGGIGWPMDVGFHDSAVDA